MRMTSSKMVDRRLSPSVGTLYYLTQQPLTEEVLRRVVREEIGDYKR
jgi:hypothetical protein